MKNAKYLGSELLSFAAAKLPDERNGTKARAAPSRRAGRTLPTRYIDLFERAPVGYLTVDRRGRIGLFNPGAARLFGMDGASIAGRLLGKLVSAESRSRIATFLAQLFGERRRLICKIEVPSKEGQPETAELVGTVSEDGNECYIVATNISARRRNTKEMKRSQAELRKLSARLVAVREEERTALARELHDGLGQMLTALTLDIAWLQRRIERFVDPEKRKESLARARELRKNIDEAIAIVRRTSSELRPASLELMGLWPALEGEAARFASRSGVKCVVRPFAQAARLQNPGLSVALFRIVQEALTNIARHAKASLVEIACEESAAGCKLTIVDDGRGISEVESSDPNSLGLIGMRERARSFGGEFSIAGAPDSGSRVTVLIPAKALRGTP
ncbi:MAG TPA: PAS domain-containing sensor histidine kinase [Rectinemataceae bacterium]|nr:PAS domain-containing sensor histidine kinase [Rectinemataceae bacterium]